MAEADEVSLQTDHDLLIRLVERTDANSKRIAELIDWKHDGLPRVIIGMQKDLSDLGRGEAALRGEVSTLCSTVDKLAESVRLLMVVPAAQERHEDSCIRARLEDIQHRTDFEKRVDQRFDASDNARQVLHDKLDKTRSWVVGGVISTLAALLVATATIIWVVIQKGGLALFHP